jgi:hypothetical protein
MQVGFASTQPAECPKEARSTRPQRGRGDHADRRGKERTEYAVHAKGRDHSERSDAAQHAADENSDDTSKDRTARTQGHDGPKMQRAAMILRVGHASNERTAGVDQAFGRMTGLGAGRVAARSLARCSAIPVSMNSSPSANVDSKYGRLKYGAACARCGHSRAT